MPVLAIEIAPLTLQPMLPAHAAPQHISALASVRRGIDTVHTRGRTNPFLFGVPFIWCSNNLVSAMLTQSMLYREISSDATYAGMEGALRDWLLGCNPWGTSMIVGLPSWGTSPKDPHSAFSHVYGYPIDGGLVDGPVAGIDLQGSHRHPSRASRTPFSEFQSDLAVYHDDWGDYSTNEPTMDGTASLDAPARDCSRTKGGSSSLLQPSRIDQGGIVRMDTNAKVVYLLFSGHEFADGGEIIRGPSEEESVRASFFFTGDFYRNPAHAPIIRSLAADGHYLGPHSDRHLLYAGWSRRDSLLVTREEFLADLAANYAAMEPFGISKERAPYFLPPYEWYNREVARWCDSVGVTIVNLTPGTFTNADYTHPEMGSQYASSDSIMARLMRVEESAPAGLNGAMVLLHIGTDPRRSDKLYARLGDMIRGLRARGYTFEVLRAGSSVSRPGRCTTRCRAVSIRCGTSARYAPTSELPREADRDRTGAHPRSRMCGNELPHRFVVGGRGGRVDAVVRGGDRRELRPGDGGTQRVGDDVKERRALFP